MGSSNAELSPAERQTAVAAVPVWWHSIDVGGGVVTPGLKRPAVHAREIAAFNLPADLRGKRVLDIGAYDGLYSFEAERRGAAEVVALDFYTWSIDFTLVDAPKIPWEETVAWQPDRLPGKRGFDTAHRLLNSRVKAIVGDFMTIDLNTLGKFDWVIFSGVLYHLSDPFGAMQRLREVTLGTAVVETLAIATPAYEHTPLWRGFTKLGKDGDPSNWWAPNQTGFITLAERAGFRTTITQGERRVPAKRRFIEWLHRNPFTSGTEEPSYYRLIAQCE